MTHRRDIQGLRAIAILLIVLAHAGVPGFTGGFVGVDVFFVLSGYLITGLLLRERETTGGIAFAEFYARRLKRLLPALLVVLLVVLALGAVLLPPTALSEQARSAGYAATWTSNLYFAFAHVDYFAEQRAQDLFLHTWSLGVEEQFYLVWPLLLVLLTRGLGDDPAQRSRRLQRRFAGVLVLGLALCGAGLALDPAHTFYMMPARLWQFALGALVYARLGSATGAKLRWAESAGWAGLALVLASAMLLEAARAGGWIVVPSVGTALLIAGGCGQATVTRGLSHPVAVWIGDRSYSWYLWHWPVLMLGASVGVTGAGVAALVLASLAFASLTYGVIEQPLWKGRWAATLRPRLVNLTAVLAMVAFVAIPARVPAGLVDLEVQERGSYAGCDDWYLSARVRPCEYGPRDAARTVVLVGDSIGAQWLDTVRAALPAPSWRTVLLTKSACAVVDEEFVYDMVGGVYRVCSVWRNAVLDYVEQLKPDLVLVGSSARYPFSREQWIDGSGRVLRRLTAAAGRTIMIAGTPSLSFDGPQCLRQNTLAETRVVGVARSCGEPWEDGRVTDVAAWLREAVRPFPTASVLDLNDRVCPSRWCRADTPEGLVVFRDSQHLSGAFTVTLAPELQAHLRRLGEGPPAQDSRPR